MDFEAQLRSEQLRVERAAPGGRQRGRQGGGTYQDAHREALAACGFGPEADFEPASESLDATPADSVSISGTARVVAQTSSATRNIPLSIPRLLLNSLLRR